MGTNPFCAHTAWLVALFVISPAALGDAPCDAGFRDVTPAERARITAALQSVKSALPPAAGRMADPRHRGVFDSCVYLPRR
jgi:hypothetical protein